MGVDPNLGFLNWLGLRGRGLVRVYLEHAALEREILNCGSKDSESSTIREQETDQDQ